MIKQMEAIMDKLRADPTPDDDLRLELWRPIYSTRFWENRRDLVYLWRTNRLSKLPPPAATEDDDGYYHDHIPSLWYELAVETDGESSHRRSRASDRLAIALWDEAFAEGRRAIRLDDEFFEKWDLSRASTDRILKRWHDLCLLIYSVRRGDDNLVLLLRTPIITASDISEDN